MLLVSRQTVFSLSDRKNQASESSQTDYVIQIAWSTHGLFRLYVAIQKACNPSVRGSMGSSLSKYKTDSEVQDGWLLYLCPLPSLYYIGQFARSTPWHVWLSWLIRASKVE